MTTPTTPPKQTTARQELGFLFWGYVMLFSWLVVPVIFIVALLRLL